MLLCFKNLPVLLWGPVLLNMLNPKSASVQTAHRDELCGVCQTRLKHRDATAPSRARRRSTSLDCRRRRCPCSVSIASSAPTWNRSRANTSAPSSPGSASPMPSLCATFSWSPTSRNTTSICVVSPRRTSVISRSQASPRLLFNLLKQRC